MTIPPAGPARVLGAALALLASGLLAGASPKRSCDVVIRGGTVIAMDGKGHLFAPGAVAIDGAKILAAGPDADIARRFAGRETFDASGEIVMPGLVNTHGHAAMTLLRGLGADLALEDWLEKRIFPAEAKNVSPSFVADGTRLACLEMIRGGTTTFADMYYFESDAARAAHDSGMRAIMGETFVDFPAPDHADLPETLRYAEAFIRKWRNDPLVTPSVAPHAPYTCSAETLLAARAMAKRFGVPIQIHVAETRKELERSLASWGLSPLARLDSIGFFGVSPTILALVVWNAPGDLEILKRVGAGIAHNPESNMKLASGAAPIAADEKAGLVWGLGTDGAASNDDLSMFEAMDFAGKLAKLSTSDPTVLPARTLLHAATLGGARVLGLDSRIGSLESGKEADVIAVSTRGVHAVPYTDPYSAVVYALKATDVTDVWVAGRRLLRGRLCQTIDAARAVEAARRWRIRIERSLAEPPKGTTVMDSSPHRSKERS